MMRTLPMSHLRRISHSRTSTAPANGWELSCDARCGLRLQLRFCCWLMKPQNRLALDSNCTLSLQNTQRGAPAGLATGYTVVPNCKVFCCEHICSNWRTYSKWEIVL